MLESSSCRTAAWKLGAHVDQLVLNILKRGQGFIDTGAICGIINMDKTYLSAAINEVCQCATELDQESYRIVKTLLKLKGSRYQLRTAQTGA